MRRVACLAVLLALQLSPNSGAFARHESSLVFPKVSSLQKLKALKVRGDVRLEAAAGQFLSSSSKGEACPISGPSLGSQSPRPVVAGFPWTLLSVFIAIALDSLAAGLLAPILPFYMKGLGAKPVDAGVTASATYASQAIGFVLMTKVTNILGRKTAVMLNLAMVSASYVGLSAAKSMRDVRVARVLAGAAGGLLPLVQGCALESSNDTAVQTMLLCRIQAASVAGFTLGPVLSVFLSSLTVQSRLGLCALFSLLGLAAVAVAYPGARSTEGHPQGDRPVETGPSPASHPPLLLPLYFAGFAATLAFSTEGLYPIVLQQSFGFGERALGLLVTTSGIAVLLLQYFYIETLLRTMGAIKVLSLGNVLLSVGLLGIAFVRSKGLAYLHFLLFIAHVLGYSLADTAIASLLSSKSSAARRGGNLTIYQATQAIARIVSPVLASLLSERTNSVGSAFYALSALFPLFGVLCVSLFLP